MATASTAKAGSDRDFMVMIESGGRQGRCGLVR
jgi:hypothetical protein